MIDGLPWQAIGVTASGWALAFLFVAGLFRGKVYVASQVDKMLTAAAAALEKAEHDRDEWRSESRIKDQQIAEKDQQLRHTGEVGHTMEAVLSMMQRLNSARSDEVDR